MSSHFQHGEDTLEVAHLRFVHCPPFIIFDYDLGDGIYIVFQVSNGIVCHAPFLLVHVGALVSTS